MFRRIPKLGGFGAAVYFTGDTAIKRSAFSVEQYALYGFKYVFFLRAFFRFGIKPYGITEGKGYRTVYDKFLYRQGNTRYRLKAGYFFRTHTLRYAYGISRAFGFIYLYLLIGTFYTGFRKRRAWWGLFEP